MQTCPRCHQTKRQNKAGKTQSGSQRFCCIQCGCKYTPEPKQHGYPDDPPQGITVYSVIEKTPGD